MDAARTGVFAITDFACFDKGVQQREKEEGVLLTGMTRLTGCRDSS